MSAADDRRVGAGAIERLLDGQHVGIVGRLGDELDHVLERLVGVLEQHVALGDDAEDVLVLLQRRNDLRRERLVLVLAQILPRTDRREVGQVQRPLEHVDVVRLQAQRRAQEVDHLGGRVVRDLQPDGAAALAPAQLFLNRLQEVVGLVLVDRKIEVAGHAKGAATEHPEAGEQLARVQGDEVLQQRERELSGPRHLGDAGEHRRHLNHRDHGLPAGDLLLLAMHRGSPG